jgi:Fe-S-cluster containining protein
MSPTFPGDSSTGILVGDEAEDWFSDFDNEPCPALDPETGTCDLYSSRPMTCRTFGPPVRCGSDAVGVCELCYEGASEAEIASCEVEIDVDGLEFELLEELEQTTGARGTTIVAFALADP